MTEHAEWACVADYLRSEIGYAVEERKYYLLNSSLRHLLSEPITTPLELVRHASSNIRLKQNLINSATINESFFFRDTRLWPAFQDRILPEITEETSYSKQIHMLVCACSKGQELYTIKMCCAAQGTLLKERDVRIVGADIDTEAMRYAQEGHYTEFESSRGLNPQQLSRYFTKQTDGYQVKDELKKNILFQQLNLNDNINFARRFDVIFCRNVLIYFSQEKKVDILSKLAKYLNNYGYLILGGAESMMNHPDWTARNVGGFTMYQKRY